MSAKLKKEGKRLVLAAAVFAAVLIAEKTGAFDGAMENRILNLALYLIPYLICGLPVLRKAVLGMAHGQMFDESFLMAVASIGAFITGENEEAAAVMLFYQVGEWFQGYAVGRSRQSITELMDIAPEYANVEREDGTVETVDPDDVEIGDILVIRPGEKIPVDARVVSGESMVNTAALTGESVPRSAGPGDEIISGCVNGEGLLRVVAEKAYQDSAVSRILELAESASEKKSKTENFITRFARWYTPLVVFGAIALAVIPSLVFGSPMTWIYRACTFLVISCPCALVISVPLAFFGGIGAASKNGVLVKGSNFLERLAVTETMISDKTGTLTEGNFKVSSVDPVPGISGQELLETAVLAEGLSTHPIAKSLREKLGDTSGINMNLVTGTENVSGQGVIAEAEGIRILVGSEKLMRSNGAFPEDRLGEARGTGETDRAATICHVARDSRYLGSVSIRDTVKAGAKEAIDELRDAGVKRFVMLTGDRKSVAEAVGRELGVDEIHAELMPEDKVKLAEEIISGSGSGCVGFIGDGINDAPVLTRADVGIAMGSLGSDAAIEAADVVIMDDDLGRIPKVIRIARRTIGISKQNIGFALGVKALILVLGALGIANMWAAVFADVGVAVICILNSMRLLAVRKTI